eukprot:m.98366 g.98366  ORF g.98366 m.98366 type:complete len:558 (+) comp13632_c0_seq1:32-1705(+)
MAKADKRKRSRRSSSEEEKVKKEAIEENPTKKGRAKKDEEGENKADVKEDVKPAPVAESGGAEADFDSEEELEPEVIDRGDISYHCPYLDTINRMILDFDFEKLCSVTMSNLNVYSCLVCGKYFQGRGKGTHAYTHSLMCDHRVFLNLETLKFYCLPDNYEIIDSSLEDIKYYLKPTFSAETIKSVEDGSTRSRALDGTAYLPGIVGLNNVKANDYVNVTLQILCRVPTFRNYFLKEENLKGIKDPLVQTFGELLRKMCNPRNFKSHVSPHEFLQAVTNASKRRFKIVEQSDPFDFLSWLLNALHDKLKKKKRSIVSDTFRGKVRITRRKLPPTQNEGEEMIDLDKPEYQEQSSDSPMFVLPLDVPPPPLFADSLEQNIIPQVPLFEMLNKFDGVTEKEYKTHKDLIVKKFRLTQLPKYLIVHLGRFTKNTFFTEKNPTVVTFPISNLILRDYLDIDENDPRLFKYDLVANIVHEGLPGAGKGTYHGQVFHKGINKWFETQDLHVDEILPQMITLSASYIQIWELQPETPQPAQPEAATSVPAKTEGDGATPMDSTS